MKDMVYLNDLHVDTVIGIHDWEKQIKQRLILNIEMSTDCKLVSTTDDLTHATDYYAASQLIKEYLENNDHQMIETVAEVIAGKLIDEFRLETVTVSVTKPGAVPGCQVGVKVNRTK